MNGSLRWRFHLCIALCVVIIFTALHRWGAAEIRANLGEVLFLTFIGFIWLLFAIQLFSWLGLSFRDDVIEHRNSAATITLCGANMGVTILYVGGSLGEGPSYWNNFFSAGMGITGWLTLWIILELGAKVSKSITEERDLASGVRMSGFLVSTALVLSRATAGNWESEIATIRDFIRDGWPAAGLCAVALPIEIFARPNRYRPFPKWVGCGLIPAIFYLALAGAWLWHLGAWEGLAK